jgi:hypothetical protein
MAIWELGNEERIPRPLAALGLGMTNFKGKDKPTNVASTKLASRLNISSK